MNDESELRRRFAALRDENAARAPSFDRVLRLGRPRKGVSIRGLATVGLVGAFASVIILLITPHRTPLERETASLAQWRAPTDFLLRTQGRELLQSVPVIGDSADGALILSPNLDLTDPHPSAKEPNT